MGLRCKLARFAPLAVLGLVIAACGDNLEPAQDVDQAVVVEIETSAPTQVAAGETINVTCTLREGDLVTMVPADVRVVSEDNVLREGTKIIARKVGTVDVSCNMASRGVADATPAKVTIVHGVAANVMTTITPDPVVAGNSVTATCTLYDAYGNLIDDATEQPELVVLPIDAGNEITGLEAYMTRAGHYTASCAFAGTTSNNAGFDVIPNLPASIVLSRWPDLPVYAVGSIVDVTHRVSDRFGNEIDEPDVTKTATPTVGPGPAVNILAGQWRFDGEGRYTVLAVVNPPTDGGVALSASVEIVVNSKGPAISCVNDAAMVNLQPGSNYTIQGNANDVNGVASLTVNGNSVAVAQDGSWSYTFVSRFGMNFANITAYDSFNQPTTKVCTFLITNRYGTVAANTTIADTVMLRLNQVAIDDNNRVDALDSLADILHAVINSPGLSNTLHTQLLAANPIKPYECHQSVWLVGCVLSSTVYYRNRNLPGPHTVSLNLVSTGANGGIQANVLIDNPAIQLRGTGQVAGIGYDTTGWVYFDYVSVQLTLDPAITAGRPRITVRPGSVSAQVGTISTDFSGFSGWIIDNILVPIANGYIRDAVRDLIRDFITNNFNAVIDGVVSNLDINSLGATFNVPRLDGSGSVPMTFSLGFSYVNATSARLLFGVGTRFSAPLVNGYPTFGVPLPHTPDVRLDPTATNTAVVAHVGVLNSALHALWRADFFKANLSASAIPGLPAGVSFNVTTRLPPVAFIAGSTPQLHLGAMDLTVTHPNLPPNLTITVGAEAHTTVNLVGNDLSFGGIVIDQLHVSTDAINLTPQQQADLQSVLQTFLQDLIDESLNDSLPAIPIPSFELPTSLSSYGLPGGSNLGVVSPSLAVQPQHFILRGTFGIQ